jgi:predicted nucleic acid-binding protein
MPTTSVKNIDNKHSNWKNILGFYKDELNVFKERLNEIAEKNTAKETMQMVEHFQNQFLIQSENIDLLQHDINEHVSVIAKEVLQHAGHVDRDQIPAHLILQERVEKETFIFKGIKMEFMNFLSRLM